jgi:hypothetical protein
VPPRNRHRPAPQRRPWPPRPKPCGNGWPNLRQQHPTARVGLCLEQPAVHLVPFLEAYNWITLHPINPITLAEVSRGVRDQPGQGRHQGRRVSGRPAPEPSRAAPGVGAAGQRHPRGATTGGPSPGGGGRAHGVEQPPDRPVKTVFPAGPHAVRRGPVAAVGDGVPAQMAEPGRGAKGQAGDGQTVLLPPRQSDRRRKRPVGCNSREQIT